jgi:hypothetical protein
VKRRAPIDTGGGRATGETDVQVARQIIDKSGVLPVLWPLLETGVGRPRTLPLEAFLVAAQLNALHRHHKAHLVEIARILNAMTPEQRASLGIGEWDPSEAYDRTERIFVCLCRVLEERPVVDGVEVDAGWFANRIMTAAIPTKFKTSSSVAVDGTDVETWGALHGDCTTVELDGEAAETQLMEEGPAKRRAVRKARVLGIGRDGRKQYTVDRDARAGHRSATNSRPAGPYVGFELHLAVQTRDVRWTDGIERTSLGPEVAGVITTFSLVAAGTHRGRAIVDELLEMSQEGDPIEDVVWDPGYSLCKPGTVHHRLAQAGIHQTFQPVTHQRGVRPFSGEALLIDGQLFSPLLPEDLRDLPVPPRGGSEEDKLAYEAKFNQRARWRLTRHAGPDADGATRWRCPFCSGLLRSRSFPKTMRHSRTAPLVEVETERCCDGILTAMPVELPWWQSITFGTTAWRISMARRQVVESANSALKGAFADLSRGFFRVMGLVKTTVLLGFTLAAYNLDRVRSFKAKHGLDADGQVVEKPKPRRARRRSGVWSEIIEGSQAPPPT